MRPARASGTGIVTGGVELGSVRRLLVIAVLLLAGLVIPHGPGREFVRYLADHDHLSVPYVRDCHGLFPHHSECRHS